MKLLSPPVPDEEIMISKLRGFPLHIEYDPHSYHGRQIYYFGRYEPCVCLFLGKHLKRSMTFLDIGANYGLHTIIAAHAVGKEGHVISFEPQQKLAAMVKHNSDINNFSNICIQQIGLSDQDQESTLYHPSTTNDGQAALKILDHEKSMHTESVLVRRLDNVLSEMGVSHVDGLKIDIEGAELRALFGASNLLSSPNPPEFILYECIDDHLKRFSDSSLKLCSFLSEHGYSIWYSRRGVWHKVDNMAACGADGYAADMLALRKGSQLDPNS